MSSIIYAFVYFIDRIRGLIGLVIPLFSDAADFRSWPLWFKVLIHVIILGVIFWGLWYLNSFPFVQNLLITNAKTFIREIYLPLIFALVYILSWLGFFWWKLLSKGDAAEFPDIAEAWAEGIKKLNASGIQIGDAPLFLVVGKPYSGDDGLFLASQTKIEVRAPGDVNSPIRIYAGRDAVYVTCPGASTWGRYCDALANPDSFQPMGGDSAGAAGKTITPDEALKSVDEKSQEEFYQLLRAQSDRSLTDEESLRLRELGDAIERAKQGIVKRVSLPADDLAIGPKRLQYLCSLIRQERRPWCPVNGCLVLIPWSALDSEEVTREAVPILGTDLATARGTLQLRYPHFVLVCDLEQANGFDEFKRGFPKDMLKQRIGQRLPLVPDRPPAEVPAMLEGAADWIRLNVMSSWVVKFLRLDWPPEARKTTQFVPGYNRKLFQFLSDTYVRGPRLGRLLSRGIPVDTDHGETVDALPLVGGCYLAATGRDDRNQAFVPGVFQRLTESQSSVSWSGAALAEDAGFRRWSTILFVVVIVIILASAGVGYVLFTGKK